MTHCERIVFGARMCAQENVLSFERECMRRNADESTACFLGSRAAYAKNLLMEKLSEA